MRRMKGIAPLAAALVSLALPQSAFASQTLAVEKQGTGTGTVISSPAGINCGATCSFAFADNTAVTLTPTSGANTGPAKWSGCEAVTAENKCKVTMSTAKTVNATFDLAKRKLSVTKAGTGTGTVKSSPAGIECGSTCTAEYEHGTEVTLTGTPGANTEAVKWSGCTSVDGEGKCKVSMTSAKSVTATFALAKRELKLKKGGLGTGTVTSSPSGINCGATCSFVFGEGQTITLTGTPSGESEAVKWTGCDSVNAEGKCIVAMNALREVGAVFNVKGPTLTILKGGNGSGTVTSSPASIDCGQACAVNFLKDQLVTLTGTPGLHSEAVKWAGCDSEPEGKCQVTMGAAREVSASFKLEPQWTEYTLSLGMKGTGKGAVQSIPTGITCPEDCSQPYVFKSSVTLVATPAPGSAFDHWSVNACTGSTLCALSVNNNRTVNAVFTAVGNRTLSVAKAGTGSGTVASVNVAGIECGSACSAELDVKTKIVLTATPQAGSTFAGWSGEGCSGVKNCRVTMNEARNVTATFAKSPTPPEAKCHVPRLKGKTLRRAKRALIVANCSLGKVKKPGGKGGRLVVRSSSPKAGATLAAGSRVALKLTRRR